MEVLLRSGEISAPVVYTQTYFSLTGASSVVKVKQQQQQQKGGEQEGEGGQRAPSKPILSQLRELLENARSDFAVNHSGNDAAPVTIILPSNSERLLDRLASGNILDRYGVMEHAAKDLQLQLSYLIAQGVAVWNMKAEDIYAVEVMPEHWRYMLLTEHLSSKGGSTDSFLTFLRDHVGPQYEGTKLYSYVRRLADEREALWI